jgi:sulfur-oxidizing protein SoxY
MDLIRRTLLRGAGAGGALVAALAAGVLKPTAVFAADWNHGAFEAKETAATLKALGAGTAADSKDLVLNAPDIAENGAVVPVDITSKIPNTVSIAVLVDKNPFPLSASFDFAEGAQADVSVRLKLSQTSNVKAVARTADGKFYTVQKEVKVTVGGCGG